MSPCHLSIVAGGPSWVSSCHPSIYNQGIAWVSSTHNQRRPRGCPSVIHPPTTGGNPRVTCLPSTTEGDMSHPRRRGMFWMSSRYN